MTTQPTDAPENDKAPYLSIVPDIAGPDGAFYVHKDLVRVTEPWSVEQHIGPIDESLSFGDVPSWASYVKTYAPGECLYTWNEHGLKAVLDYHLSDESGLPIDERAGRCQWVATMPFRLSLEWQKWSELCQGAKGQREVIEFLEDRWQDIVSPDGSELLNILRQLRSHVTNTAESDLNADGSYSVKFSQSGSIRSGSDMVGLPGDFTVAIPVLKGHTDDAGNRVIYNVVVKMRVTAGDDAKLRFRFAMPNAERILEDVFADRVEKAQEAIGTPLLRTA